MHICNLGPCTCSPSPSPSPRIPSHSVARSLHFAPPLSPLTTLSPSPLSAMAVHKGAIIGGVAFVIFVVAIALIGASFSIVGPTERGLNYNKVCCVTWR